MITNLKISSPLKNNGKIQLKVDQNTPTTYCTILKTIFYETPKHNYLQPCLINSTTIRKVYKR